MATYTSYLNLKKPDGSERYALADFNANMQKIDDFATAINGKVVRTTSNNIAGVSGSNNAGFIVNLMQALASRYDFSTLAFGDVIAGRAEWAGVDYVHFTVTKVTGSTWNVFITASSRIVTGYYNASNGTVTGVKDVIDQMGDLHMVRLTKTVNNGFFSISASEIPFGKKLIIQNAYVSSNHSADLTFAVQSNSSGSAAQYYVYVRKNGAIPANDTSITVNILYMN